MSSEFLNNIFRHCQSINRKTLIPAIHSENTVLHRNLRSGGVAITTESEIKSKMLVSTPLKLRIMEYLKRPRKVVDIVKILNVHRDTIKPHLRYLSVLNLIVKENDFYRLTDIGKVVTNKLKEIEGLIELTEKHGEFLTSHDLSFLPDSLLRDIHMLRDCSVFVKNDPYELQQEWIEIVRKSKWLNGVSSVYHPKFPQIFFTLAKDRDVKIVVTENVLEKIKNDNPELLEKYIKWGGELYLCDRVTENFWVTELRFLMYLNYTDGIFDPSNVFICDSCEGREWGLRLFESYLKKSISPD